jgi:hypothetical protein
MKEQLETLVDIFVSPRTTLLSLPSNRVYSTAFLILMYFDVIRAFRPRYHQLLLDKLGGDLQIVLLSVALSFVTIPLGAWILQEILIFFDKRLRVRKIINICGTARIPHFLSGMILSTLIQVKPELLVSDESNSGPDFIFALSMFGMLYSLVLLIYGLVICPSEDF